MDQHNSLPGKVTFRQLDQHAKDNIYVSAVYDDQETKITGFRSVVPAHSLNNLVAFFPDIDIRKVNEKKLTEYQVARLTGTIKNLRKVSLSTVDRELSKAAFRARGCSGPSEQLIIAGPLLRAIRSTEQFREEAHDV
jgi:hypothetical protein